MTAPPKVTLVTTTTAKLDALIEERVDAGVQHELENIEVLVHGESPGSSRKK